MKRVDVTSALSFVLLFSCGAPADELIESAAAPEERTQATEEPVTERPAPDEAEDLAAVAPAPADPEQPTPAESAASEVPSAATNARYAIEGPTAAAPSTAPPSRSGILGPIAPGPTMFGSVRPSEDDEGATPTELEAMRSDREVNFPVGLPRSAGGADGTDGRGGGTIGFGPGSDEGYGDADERRE